MYSCTARTCRARSRTRALRATAIPPPSRPTTTIPAGSASRAASRRRSCRNWRGAATRSSAGPTGSGSLARCAASSSIRNAAPWKPAPTPAAPPTHWGGSAESGPPASGRHAAGTAAVRESLGAAAADVLVGRAVAMRVGGGLAAGRRNHVDIGVIGDRALLARTNLKHRRIGPGTVLQAMPVEIVGRKPGGVAGAQDLLAGIGDEHDLARQHVDEFILAGMPMALARPGAGRQAQQIDPELRQPRGIAEAGALAGAARLVIGRRVHRAGDRFEALHIQPFCHRCASHPLKSKPPFYRSSPGLARGSTIR